MQAIVCLMVLFACGFAAAEQNDQLLHDLIVALAKTQRQLPEEEVVRPQPIFPACIGADGFPYSMVSGSACVVYNNHSAEGRKTQASCSPGTVFDFQKCSCSSRRSVDITTCTTQLKPLKTCISQTNDTLQPLPGCTEFAIVSPDGNDLYSQCEKDQMFDLNTCSCGKTTAVDISTCNSELSDEFVLGVFDDLDKIISYYFNNFFKPLLKISLEDKTTPAPSSTALPPTTTSPDQQQTITTIPMAITSTPSSNASTEVTTGAPSTMQSTQSLSIPSRRRLSQADLQVVAKFLADLLQ